MSDLELVCPAGTPATLRAAVDAGADAVYLGFRDATNARNFPGLNFDRDELREGLGYAHRRNCRVFVAINTFPEAGNPGPWQRAVDDAAALGADAVIGASPLPGWPGVTVGGLWVGAVAPAPARAYLARRLLPADNMLTAATTMAAASFRPSDDAVVAGGGGATALAGGRVRELAGPPHDRRFDVAALGPGLLVVQQSFMGCWRARVDGRPAELEVANGVAAGVRVPAGRHRVEFALHLAPYRIGAAGPLLLLLFAALNLAGGSSRGRAASSGGEARTPPATPPAP